MPRQPINFVDDSDFADWDYTEATRDETYPTDTTRRNPDRSSALETYAQRRRGRVITISDKVARVRWLEDDPYAHALVRRFAMSAPADDAELPPASGLTDESLTLVPAKEGFEVPLALDDDSDLHAAILRANVWPFEQRQNAVRTALSKSRVPHSAGRVELKARRSDCYGGALKAYKQLSARAWRMGWFVKFHQEVGLDAGGLSREFWRLALATAFSEEKGLFARTSNGTYDCVDAFELEIADRLPEYRFVGRCLAKLLFDHHSGCLEAAVSVKILKLLVGEPVVFDDLQLVDEELWLSLTKLEALANNDEHGLEDLCLTFAVDRVSVVSGDTVAVELVPGGADLVVNGNNIDAFLEARMREAFFEKHRNQLLALLAGFYDICPPAVVLLLTARELELALCGELKIDIKDWMQHTNYHGAFEAKKADHPICRAFWNTVTKWDDAQRTRLLQWAVGTARLPLGGFANLQQRDGVSRKFTLTSVPIDTAVYPRSHTCVSLIFFRVVARSLIHLSPSQLL